VRSLVRRASRMRDAIFRKLHGKRRVGRSPPRGMFVASRFAPTNMDGTNVKITASGHSMIQRALPPTAETNSADSEPLKPASAPHQSAAAAKPQAASFTHPLSNASKWQLTTSTQQVEPAETSVAHTSPAQRARAALQNDPSLRELPFGAVVSAIARGEPLPSSGALSPAQPAEEPSDVPAETPAEPTAVESAADDVGTHPVVTESNGQPEDGAAAEATEELVSEIPILPLEASGQDGATPIEVDEPAASNAADAGSDDTLIEALLEQLTEPVTFATDSPLVAGEAGPTHDLSV
jgi:hypothetical protein